MQNLLIRNCFCQPSVFAAMSLLRWQLQLWLSTSFFYLLLSVLSPSLSYLVFFTPLTFHYPLFSCSPLHSFWYSVRLLTSFLFTFYTLNLPLFPFLAVFFWDPIATLTPFISMTALTPLTSFTSIIPLTCCILSIPSFSWFLSPPFPSKNPLLLQHSALHLITSPLAFTSFPFGNWQKSIAKLTTAKFVFPHLLV